MHGPRELILGARASIRGIALMTGLELLDWLQAIPSDQLADLQVQLEINNGYGNVVVKPLVTAKLYERICLVYK